MQKYWIRICRIVHETPEVVSYFLDCPDDFTWEEGAHTHLGLQGFDAGSAPDRSRVRHMSIATLPQEGIIRITTRIKTNASPFKQMLARHVVGDTVALFKTHSNIPLERTGQPVYLLSQGVGLATFRPHALTYLNAPENIPHMHSLNVDGSGRFLFKDIFESQSAKHFTAQFVDHREAYYAQLRELATDGDGVFYIVGSDAFLLENIAVLQAQGVMSDRIHLDKRTQQIAQFKPLPENAPESVDAGMA